MKRVVISDTSCLIILSKINKLDILKYIFAEVIITKEVESEFSEEIPDWVIVKTVENDSIEKILNLNLDKGEASSIALCLKYIDKDVLLVIDERKGRNIAKELGINIIGTIGILTKAKDLNIISDMNCVIADLEKNNFRISETLKNQLLNK